MPSDKRDTRAILLGVARALKSLRYGMPEELPKRLAKLVEDWPMPTIYISDSGDDKNDGLSLQTAIYSLERAKKLQGGRNDYSWHFGPRAWKRIQKELFDKKKSD